MFSLFPRTFLQLRDVYFLDVVVDAFRMLHPTLAKKCHDVSAFGGSSIIEKKTTTPLKINMEHSHGGLEDHFPF